MNEEKKVALYTLQQSHFYFATDCFAECRKLLEKTNRTPEEDELLKHLAHTSLYHWLQVGTIKDFQRCEWMLARIYTVLESKAKALHYAQRCLELTQRHDLKDTFLAYAYESVARAYALTGDKVMCDKYYALAEDAGKQIVEEDDKKIFFDELKSGKWFGMAE
jgi:tetratricopeptide (TPR) repeat protein